MTTIVSGLAELKGLAGTDLGHTGWLEVSQQRVNAFADATGDDQWIHVDPVRAAAGPFRGTIAHGYLTLSLVVPLLRELLEVRDVRLGVNYGVNQVRFPAPVPAGSRIRLGAVVAAAEPAGRRAVQLTMDFTVETEGRPDPALLAQVIYRYYA